MTKDYPPGWRAAAALPGLLEPGERVLWQGCPTPATGLIPRENRPGILAACACGVLFALWALFDRPGDGMPSAALIAASVVSLLVGLLLAIGPRPVRAYRRHHAYAVTDRRVLMLEQRRNGLHVEAYGPGQIAFVVAKDRGDGRADVWFREGPWLRRMTGSFAEGPQNPVGFLALRDPGAATQALIRLRARQAVAPPAHAWDASPAPRSGTDHRP